MNRKNVHSINVQAVCDSDCKFIDLIACWPGSVNDSRIFKHSTLDEKLKNGDTRGILLGDNGWTHSDSYIRRLGEAKRQELVVLLRNHTIVESLLLLF